MLKRVNQGRGDFAKNGSMPKKPSRAGPSTVSSRENSALLHRAETKDHTMWMILCP